jgi:hypothetical protein
MTQFTFNDDYKNEFKRYIDVLFTYAKLGDLADRTKRMSLIDELIESYIAATGHRPDSVQLDRLATLCLYEEITDNHPDKMTREEYPIMSEEQYARRTEGKHVKRTDKNGNKRPNTSEIPLKAAYDYGTDGRNYRTPKRRRLSTNEALELDRKRSRNKEREKRYKEFIKPGKVEVKRIDDKHNDA